MINNPPAYCPDHGLFPAKGFALGISGSHNFSGCSDRCPACGKQSEVLSGTYEALPGRLDFVLDNSVSAEALEALLRLAQRVKRNEIPLSAARAEAERIAPRAGKLFENWSEQSKTAIAAALIGAIAIVAAARVSRSPEQTVIVQPVIERIIEVNLGRQQEKPQSAPQSAPLLRFPSEKTKDDR